MRRNALAALVVVLAGCVATFGCAGASNTAPKGTLTDEQVENLVRRSYQYVAMYNVNNKFALKQGR